MSQFASWAAAIIIGGGTAGAVQMSTVAVRGVSTATTGGVANPLVSTVEWIGAVLLSVLSLLVPVLVVVVGIILAIWAVRWFKRKKQESISTPL